MRPDDLTGYRVPSDPRLHPDGVEVAFVVTRADFDDDRYVRRIWLWDGAEARPLTAGPDDTSPRWSPDGTRLAFLRRGPDEGDRPQVAVLPVAGGEAETITEFPLGVTELEWTPDGRLVVAAAEWLHPDLDDEERRRRPRRIRRIPFRFDARGWIHDRRTHLWVVEPGGDAAPRCLTPGEFDEGQLAVAPDGEMVAFVSARHPERGLDPGTQVWTVPLDGGDAEAVTDVGMWSLPTWDRDGRLHVVGLPDRWSHPNVYPLWRRESEGWAQVTDLDRNLVVYSPAVAPAGPRWLDDGSAFSILEDGGRLRVVRLRPDGAVEEIVGGDRLVTGIDPRPDGSAAVFVATAPTDPGELWWWDAAGERRLTDLNDAFRARVPLVEPERFTFEVDGVEIEGWAYLPPGDGAVPLLLNIHGGPATQYGYGFFDEFQVYVRAGYGVVATNPRGSSGYGKDHVRAVVGRWGEPDPPDLRDLLTAVDAAAEAFPRLDRDRRGVMGGSYGGFATVRVLAADPGFRSAVAERGLYTWSSFVGTSDIGPWFARVYVGSGPPDGWEELWRASPLSRAHRIATPTLVLHSEEDWRCPAEQAEQLFALLLAAGVETELVRFPAPEGHELSRGGKPRHRRERFEVILDWHARHLGPEGGDPA